MAKLTTFKRDDFYNVLKHYNIGSYVSSKHIGWALANTVYILKTTKGKYILKIFENADPNFIKFQTKLINFCSDKNLPVPKIIKTKRNHNLLLFNKHRIQIQKFIKGKEPKKFNPKLIKNVAKKQALMNKNFLRLKLTGKYTWGIDYEFKKLNFPIKRFKTFNIWKEDTKIINDLKKISKRKLRKSIVHGDFHGTNLIVHKSKLVGIIDWDDTHEDFLVHELCSFIAHSFIKPNNIDYKGIKIYLREYHKYLRINKEERKALYYFIKKRFLAAIAWHAVQIRNHKDIKSSIETNIKGLIKQYRNFDKVSLEEFLGLF